MPVTLENYEEWEDNISSVSRFDLTSRVFHYHAVTTQHGFVMAWVVSENKWQTTKLEFIHNRKKHHRRWDRRWGDKTITRLAREFVEDVVGKGGSDGRT